MDASWPCLRDKRSPIVLLCFSYINYEVFSRPPRSFSCSKNKRVRCNHADYLYIHVTHTLSQKLRPEMASGPFAQWLQAPLGTKEILAAPQAPA